MQPERLSASRAAAAHPQGMKQSRQPRGIPSGGQFAERSQGENDLNLDTGDTKRQERMTDRLMGLGSLDRLSGPNGWRITVTPHDNFPEAGQYTAVRYHPDGSRSDDFSVAAWKTPEQRWSAAKHVVAAIQPDSLPARESSRNGGDVSRPILIATPNSSWNHYRRLMREAGDDFDSVAELMDAKSQAMRDLEDKELAYLIDREWPDPLVRPLALDEQRRRSH